MRNVAVALAGFVLGGWAVPLGFVLGLGPIGTYVGAAGGGLLGCWTFLLFADRITTWWRRRRPHAPEAGEQAAEAAGRIRHFADRFGVRGLGLVGPIFPGVTVSLAGGLALGLDRRKLGRWMSVGILAMYGLYVVGLWLLLYLI